MTVLLSLQVQWKGGNVPNNWLVRQTGGGHNNCSDWVAVRSICAVLGRLRPKETSFLGLVSGDGPRAQTISRVQIPLLDITVQRTAHRRLERCGVRPHTVPRCPRL